MLCWSNAPRETLMYDRPTVVALREHLAAVVQAHPSLADEHNVEAIRARVGGVVDDLKAAGWPPERVIIAVKQIAADAGLSPSRSVLSATLPLNEYDAAIVNMVRWCIEQYYGVSVVRTPTSTQAVAE